MKATLKQCKPPESGSESTLETSNKHRGNPQIGLISTVSTVNIVNMARPRRNPASRTVQLTIYVDPDTATTLKGLARAAGLTIGGFLDDRYSKPEIDQRPGHRVPAVPENATSPAKPVVGHVWRTNTVGVNVCGNCGGLKTKVQGTPCQGWTE